MLILKTTRRGCFLVLTKNEKYDRMKYMIEAAKPTPESEGNVENFEKLSFAELERAQQEINRLAEISFKQDEDGFKNAKGSGLYMEQRYETFKLVSISDDLRDVHAYVALHAHELIMTKGSKNPDEVLTEMRSMLEKLGKRIIE